MSSNMPRLLQAPATILGEAQSVEFTGHLQLIHKPGLRRLSLGTQGRGLERERCVVNYVLMTRSNDVYPVPIG